MSMHIRKQSRHLGRPMTFLWLTAMCLVITLALACLLTACRGETGMPDDSGEQSEYTDTTTADTPGTTETSAPEDTPGESTVTDDWEPTESITAGDPIGTDAPDTAGEPTETNQRDTSEETADPEVLTLPPEPDTLPPDTGEAEETIPFDPSSVAKETMPRLDIVTEGGQSVTSKEVYVRCTVSMSDCDASFAFTDSPAGIRVRGNSTAGAPKKPYRLKFDVKQPMLDLNDGNAFRNWCLMADYFDSSMLRTYATLQMAEALLDGCVYSSDCAHVEVYLNGVYQGVYLLCEQTQINKNRISIYEKEDQDTSLEVGYLMIGQGGRFDEPGNIKVYPDITVTDRNGQSMHYGEMNFALQGSEYTEEQKAYCSTYVSAVFQVIAKALYEEKYYSLSRDGTMVRRTFPAGTTTEEKQIQTIDAVFNIQSAVRLCILDEIVKNLDAMTFNMYVDLSPWGDGRLTLAAPWDFDFSMANTHYNSTHSATGFYATNLSASDGVRVNLFYVMFGRIGWFEDMVKQVWQAHHDDLLAVAQDVLVESLRYDDAFSRDFVTWDRPLGGTFSHHCTEDLARFSDHMDTAYFVNDWLLRRLAWLDRRWGDGMAEAAEPSPLLNVDLTNPENAAYLSGFQYCQGIITANGLYLTQDEGYDPQFYIDFTGLPETFEAEDYPYLEIICMVPATNQLDEYSTELFLCSGSVSHARAECRTAFSLEGRDGVYHTYRIDLSETGFWEGTIHRIRIDFFGSCLPGDAMYISRIALKAK